MSFSSDIRAELCDVRSLTPEQSAAVLYGIFYASREENGRPLVQTENLELMNATVELLHAVFPGVHSGIVRLVKNSGSLYTLKIKSGWERISERFGDMSTINGEAVPGSDECSGAFLRGVFISCGSVTPSGGSPNVALSVLLPPSQVSCIAISRASIRQPSSTTVTTSPTS